MRLSPRFARRRIAQTTLLTLLATLAATSHAGAATYSGPGGTVLGESPAPLAFYKLDEPVGAITAANAGSLGAAADGSYTRAGSVRLGREAAIECERRTHWGGFPTAECQARNDAAGSSAYFAGAPYNAQVGASSVPESLSFTLEAWVKPTEALSDGGIVDHGPNGALILQDGVVSFITHATDENVVATDAAPLSTGDWHHVVGTWDNGASFPGSGTGRLYVDGVLVDTDTGASLHSGAINGSGSTFYIGWTNESGASAFRGFIDNVAYYGDDIDVFDHWLEGPSPAGAVAEVTSLTPENGSAFSTGSDAPKVAQTRLKYTCSGACTYSVAKPVGPPTAGAGANVDVPLPLDGGLGTYTITVTAAGGYTATSTYTLGNFSTVILNDAPTGWWRFNELDGNPVAADSAAGALYPGYYQNPSANGGTGISGDANAARQFLAGKGGYVGINNVEAKREAYTIELWFKTSDNDDMALFDHGAHGGGPALYLVGNDIRHRTVDGQVMSAGFVRGDWTHVAATWDGVAARLYVQGVGQGAPMASSLSPSGTPALYLGFANVGLVTPAFRGLMDEVSYYGKALSADRVFNHYLADPPPPAAHAAAQTTSEPVVGTADSSLAATPQTAAPDKRAATRAHAKAKARAKARAKAKAKALAKAKARARAKAKAKKARATRRHR